METISTLLIESQSGKMMGNTTRQVNFAIDQLFQGKGVQVEDHIYKDYSELRGSKSTKKHSVILLKKIIDRLTFEFKLKNNIDFKITKNEDCYFIHLEE